MEDQFLVEIKELGRAGRLEEAVAVCERLEDDPAVQSVAYYSLGILFHTEGPKQDFDRAETYYLQAEKGGSCAALATYWLARLHLARGMVDRALERFRRVADEDASAAYWAYRLLMEHPDRKTSADEARHFRDLAITLGHVVARREEIFDRLKWKHGFIPFMRAIPDYIRLIPEIYEAIRDEKKFLYQ